MTSLAPHMEAFLREYLVRHRGASQHTCDSYAYSFQSLFEFASQTLKVAPSALLLEQLDASLISSFLEHLETTRGNSAETRNIRLAAIRSFFRFLQHREPAAVGQVRRVLAIPFKKTDHRLVPYLAQEEMQALLDAPDPSTRTGVRDRAILHLAVCAGLRVSELTGLRTDDVAWKRRDWGTNRPKSEESRHLLYTADLRPGSLVSRTPHVREGRGAGSGLAHLE